MDHLAAREPFEMSLKMGQASRAFSSRALTTHWNLPEFVMELLDFLLGAGEDSTSLSALQMGARAVLIYIVTLVIVRIGKRRFMGRATAFDMIVGIVLGSIVSRAITGNAPMLPAMTSAAVVMALHWFFSAAALRWHAFGSLIKGRPRVLLVDGKLDEAELRSAHMTEGDLREALREQGFASLSGISKALLERDGKVSVIKVSEPKVVSIDVAPGVQTIRIELTR